MRDLSVKDLTGKTVTWSFIGSDGKLKTKTGKILASIEPGYNARDALPLGVAPARIKFKRYSPLHRYLVEVPRFHKGTGETLSPSYYTLSIDQEFEYI